MKKYFLASLAGLFVLGFFAVRCLADDVSEGDRLKIITRLTARLLDQQHYRRQALDETMSPRIFDEYFKSLDPGKMYFTRGDIRAFEPRKAKLAEQLKNGDPSFAFDVHKRFMARFNEFHAFAIETLKTPFDFGVDESMAIDRRDIDYPADDGALRELWRQKLKNDVLYFRLIRRSLDEDRQAARSAADVEKQNIRTLWDKQTPEAKVLKRFHDLRNFYNQRDKVDILSGYLNAVSLVYGPHSGYLAPKNDEDFEISMSLSLSGIGATLTSDDGYIRVIEVVPGGPADRDGRLKAEDRIIAVAQETGEPADVIDMSVDNAVKLIRGPAGTKVTLTVLPGKKGRGGVPENITITRGKVELKNSEAHSEIRTVKENGREMKIGIITLPGFYMDFSAYFRGDVDAKRCSEDVRKLLDGFKKEKVDAVVMDLRNNGGGSLSEAISLTGLFIKDGPVVQVRQANRKIQVESDTDGGAVAWDGPLVVLTNKLSASATEIFAGAIKDYRRGIVVGDSRTFGKGTVLTLIPLERMLGFLSYKFPAGSVRLESAMFFRVNGESVQQLGVKPDIALPSLTEPMEIGEMFSDNHLPWDSIRSLQHDDYGASISGLLPKLREDSAARIGKSTDYQRFLSRIGSFKEQLAKKSISLNENARWSEYLKEKHAQDTEEDLLDESPKEKSEDLVLDETLNIAAEYAAARK